MQPEQNLVFTGGYESAEIGVKCSSITSRTTAMKDKISSIPGTDNDIVNACKMPLI